MCGAEAVIDKDHASALLARDLAADCLLLLTDVDGVYTDWRGQNARRIAATNPESLRRMCFDSGSMGPKVEAVCNFVDATGGIAAIGALGAAAQMLAGKAGTRVTPDADVLMA